MEWWTVIHRLCAYHHCNTKQCRLSKLYSSYSLALARK